jgi:hypothetical protein
VDRGVAVARLQAREYVPNGNKVGLTVNLGSGGYVPGNCQTRVDDPFWCTHTDETNWQRFTMEVVDRVGNDSFTPGHGVLLAQTRNSGTPRVQLVDANTANINRIDFYRPDGTPVPVVRGDPRQLDDATFHAGSQSGSQYEYVENFNRLHFYVLDADRDENGVLSYHVAVRNLDGAGAYARSGSLGAAAVFPSGAATALLQVPLTNTGAAGEGLFASDVYRIAATVDGAGWTVHLPYAIRAAEAGATVTVPVYATAAAGATESATVTVTATSEADPTVKVATQVALDGTDLKVTFDSARGLVESYHAAGTLQRSERQRLLAQLQVAEQTRGRAARMAIDRFIAIAHDVADIGARTLASAALASVGRDLRREV